jgi:hypothetical protein
MFLLIGSRHVSRASPGWDFDFGQAWEFVLELLDGHLRDGPRGAYFEPVQAGICVAVDNETVELGSEKHIGRHFARGQVFQKSHGGRVRIAYNPSSC